MGDAVTPRFVRPLPPFLSLRFGEAPARAGMLGKACVRAPGWLSEARLAALPVSPQMAQSPGYQDSAGVCRPPGVGDDAAPWPSAPVRELSSHWGDHREAADVPWGLRPDTVLLWSVP